MQNLRAQEAALAEAEEREDLEIAAEVAGKHNKTLKLACTWHCKLYQSAPRQCLWYHALRHYF